MERKGSGPQILWPRTAPECDFISLVEGLGAIVTDNICSLHVVNSTSLLAGQSRHLIIRRLTPPAAETADGRDLMSMLDVDELQQT